MTVHSWMPYTARSIYGQRKEGSNPLSAHKIWVCISSIKVATTVELFYLHWWSLAMGRHLMLKNRTRQMIRCIPNTGMYTVTSVLHLCLASYGYLLATVYYFWSVVILLFSIFIITVLFIIMLWNCYQSDPSEIHYWLSGFGTGRFVPVEIWRNFDCIEPSVSSRIGNRMDQC